MRNKTKKNEKKGHQYHGLFYYPNDKEKKISDLTMRIVFTLIVLIVIRIGSNIQIPGLDAKVFTKWFEEKFSSSGCFFNALTGGSFANMSVLALNIMPVITSSIIIQFVSMLVKPLERFMREPDGQKIMAQVSRYLSIGIAFVEGVLFAFVFYKNGYFTNNDALAAFTMVFILAAGTAVVLWFADLISEYGIGNGITVILVADILMSVPSDVAILWKNFVSTRNSVPSKFGVIIAILAIMALFIAYVVIMQECEHRFLVRGSHGSSTIAHMNETIKKQNYIPLKLNSAGVMPIIFAQTILGIPAFMYALGFDVQKGVFNFITLSFEQRNWFNVYYPEYSFGIVVYAIVLIAFFYFYANLAFNPDEIADYLRETGGVIPGIRPGVETSRYLKKSAKAMNFIGACVLGVASLIPVFINSFFRIGLSMGGTSTIIIVGGITEIIQQIKVEKYQQRLPKNLHR